MSTEMRKLIDLVEDAQINSYLDRLKVAETQEEFDSILKEAELYEAPGMVDKIKTGARNLGLGALAVGSMMGGGDLKADPSADVDTTAQTVQQAVKQTGISGVDSSTYIFPVGNGMYNQTDIGMTYDSFPTLPGQTKQKTRPVILPDNKYAPPKADYFNNFAYGSKVEIPADKLGKQYNNKETNYTDQWEANLIKDALTQIYKPMHDLFIPYHKAHMRRLELFTPGTYQNEFKGDLDAYTKEKNKYGNLRNKYEKELKKYYYQNVGLLYDLELAPKSIARLHFKMQQIERPEIYGGTRDINQLIREETRGLKGVAKQVKTEVITAIYNRYYAKT